MSAVRVINDSKWKYVTDLLGNKVKIKAGVERIAVVPIPWAAIVYAVDGTGKRIAGMHPLAMQSYHNDMLKRMAPELAKANSHFVDESFHINYEDALKLKPDVIFLSTGCALWDYNVKNVQKELAGLGIPSVVVKYGTLDDLQDGIRLVGEILNQQERADALIQYHKDTNCYLQSKKYTMNRNNQPKVLYLRGEQLQVAVGDSVNQIMIENAGGVNVASEVIRQWVKIPMEQIRLWNPDVIIISNFSGMLPDDLYANSFPGQDWSRISAVRNKKVYKAPAGFYRWDAPCVETPLMMKWLGKVLQPELFSDCDLRMDLKSFYSEFFQYVLSDIELDKILKSNHNTGLKI